MEIPDSKRTGSKLTNEEDFSCRTSRKNSETKMNHAD